MARLIVTIFTVDGLNEFLSYIGCLSVILIHVMFVMNGGIQTALLSSMFLSSVFQTYDFTSDDLTDLGEIGRGNYGTVNKMKHTKSGTIMSVKVSFEGHHV